MNAVVQGPAPEAVRGGVPVSPQSAMRRALELAALGAASTQPNPRVGCVIVRDGRVVGEGWHRRAGEPHAEVHALAQAGALARGADVYVTLEPCNHHGRTPPCVDALIAAGVARVHAAVVDSDPRTAGAGLARLQSAGIEVAHGLCADEARAQNRGFFSRLQRGRPWLTLKLAASLDGRTALANGESRWITGPAARADVHRLRAEAGAVLVGADTALADDPALTVRDWQPAAPASMRVPDRVVLDSRARVPAGAKLWADDGARRFWLTAEEGAAPDGVQRIAVARTAAGHLDLAAALRGLAQREVGELLVEAGPQLAGALIAAGLVDELIVYVAPTLLGADARALAQLPALARLADAPRWRHVSATLVGADLRLVLQPLADPTS